MTNTFYIEVLPPDGKVWYFSLPAEPVMVGRSSNRCKLIVNDPRISRIHLRIFRSPDVGVTITDMYSAHGSKLDGHPLPSGMAISWLLEQTATIGGTTLILRYGLPPEPTQ
jgi:hypothetical protein